MARACDHPSARRWTLAQDFDGYGLQFLGAARTVTGSKTLVTAGATQVLVDCGLFQGLKELRLRNWTELPVDPATIDHVVLTHAHIDHTGYLPRLVALGFRGTVWTTEGTRELSDLMLRDSAHLQEEEAAYANRRGYSKHNPALPLYRVTDAERALSHFRAVDFGQTTTLSDTVAMTFHRAGHILGSAIVELAVTRDGETRRLVFSGDLGRYDSFLMKDPDAVPPGADYLVVESTYGNREHGDADPHALFADLVRRIVRDRGVLLVPAFAVGRTQEVLLLLKEGMNQGTIPRVPVHLDSPMAIDATEIYCRHTDEQRAEHHHEGGKGCAFFFGDLKLHQTVEDSKRLGAMAGPRVIISASGMATGGRILHHLRGRLGDARNIVVFVGFQAQGTRGRSLVDGADTVRMFGEEIPVRATIARIDALSAHADRSELLRWTGTLGAKAPRRTFVTHGEPEAAESFAQAHRDERGWDMRVPAHLEKAPIF
jgi:metallo-beta-lactamase family protein